MSFTSQILLFSTEDVFMRGAPSGSPAATTPDIAAKKASLCRRRSLRRCAGANEHRQVPDTVIGQRELGQGAPLVLRVV